MVCIAIQLGVVVNYDQQAHGMGFGGTTQKPRLLKEESFDYYFASFRNLTFDNIIHYQSIKQTRR